MGKEGRRDLAPASSQGACQRVGAMPSCTLKLEEGLVLEAPGQRQAGATWPQPGGSAVRPAGAEWLTQQLVDSQGLCF